VLTEPGWMNLSMFPHAAPALLPGHSHGAAALADHQQPIA
jgi:hypothetical protein